MSFSLSAYSILVKLILCRQQLDDAELEKPLLRLGPPSPTGTPLTGHSNSPRSRLQTLSWTSCACTS